MKIVRVSEPSGSTNPGLYGFGVRGWFKLLGF